MERVRNAIGLVVFGLLLSACGGGGGNGGEGGSGGGTQPPASFTVSTTTAGNGGGTTSPGSRTVTQGGTTSFTIAPAQDSAIASVSGCGGSLSGTIYTTGAINSNCTVTATFDVASYLVAATASSGGSISPDSVNVTHGNTMAFTVTPDSGHEIESVSGCGGTLSGNTYTTGLVMAACSVSARFRQSPVTPPPATFTVTTSTSGTGTGTITPGSATVTQGQTASFTLTPGTGSEIDSVMGCGGSLSGNTYSTGPINANCQVTASFRAVVAPPPASYSVTTTTSGNGTGSISPGSANVMAGQTASFQVNPAEGSSISSVTGCGGALSGNTYTTGPINANCQMTTTFSLNSYTVTANAGQGGSISPTTTSVEHSSTVTFNVTPETGHSIASVSGCEGTLNGATYTTGPVYANCLVTATFSLNTYPVTATAGAGGSISPSSVTVDHGSAVSFSVTAQTGFSIASVSGCNGSLDGMTYTTGSISAACSVTASFSQNVYEVTANAGEGGSIDPAFVAVVHGATTTFSVTVDEGYAVTFVDGCDGAMIGDTYQTGPIVGACEVNAQFGILPVATLLEAEAKPRAVNLTWHDTGADFYNIYYSSVPDCPPENYSVCPGGTLVPNVPSPYEVRGLENGQNYWFYIESVTTGGTARSNEVGARPDKLVIDGSVQAISLDEEGNVYIGGRFRGLTPRTGNGVPIGKASGRPGAFETVNGQVHAAIPDGEGGWYIGGAFTEVGGISRLRLAHILGNGRLGAWNPVANGPVYALVHQDEIVYAGGSFSTIDGAPRDRLAAIDENGSLLPWNPQANGQVSSLAVSQDVVYLGGSFTSISGATRNRLAAVGVDGILRSWNPDANDRIKALAIIDDTVYAGGWFTSIGGVPRNHLAAISAEGTLRTWNPNPNGRVEAVTTVQNTIFVGGRFDQISGLPRTTIAAIHRDGTLLAWSPNIRYEWTPVSSNGYVFALAADADTVYIGGSFSSVDGYERINLASVTVDGTLTPWNPRANWDVYALGVSAGSVYVGGSFSGIGGERRSNLASMTPDGILREWGPSTNETVHEVVAVDGTVYIGGYFDQVEGRSRSGLAAIATDGTLLDWNPNPRWQWDGGSAPGEIYAIAVLQGVVYIGGRFNSVGDVNRNGLAAIALDETVHAWNPDVIFDGGSTPRAGTVRSMVISGSTVYAGGDFTRVSNTTRNGIAAVDIDGSLLAWNPDVGSSLSTTGAGEVFSLAIAADTVYVGGYFTSIGGVPRKSVAAVGVDGALKDWNPGIGVSSSDDPGYVSALAIENEDVYVGGSFNMVGGALRSGLVKITNNGTLDPWDPRVGGQVSTLYVRHSKLYLGGHFLEIAGEAISGFAVLPVD